MRAFAQSEVSAAVVTPLVVGRWIDDEHGYSFPAWFEEDLHPEPAIALDEIKWCVSVRPASAFGWTALHEELSRRGRTKIGEDHHRIEVGARNAQNARTLVAELKAVALSVRRASGRLAGSAGGESDSNCSATTPPWGM
jgi:hypothetical protein